MHAFSCICQWIKYVCRDRYLIASVTHTHIISRSHNLALFAAVVGLVMGPKNRKGAKVSMRFPGDDAAQKSA